MKITWLGHSCFSLEYDGYKIITDPYEGVPGYPDLNLNANAVYCSHQHFDHNAVHRVTVSSAAKSPFKIREIPAYHDDKQGKSRGENMIRVFTAGGVSVAHMGDLGHLLTPVQKSELGAPDVILMPIGGVYTLDARQAKKACDEIGARCVIPMHYHHTPYGLSNLGGLDEFLALWNRNAVHMLPGPDWTVTHQLSGVIVPMFRA